MTMSIKPGLEPSHLATLAEVILINRFKCKFRVEFMKDTRVFGFIMRLHFEREDGSWAKLDNEYEGDINDTELMTEELFAQIALMR